MESLYASFIGSVATFIMLSHLKCFTRSAAIRRDLWLSGTYSAFAWVHFVVGRIDLCGTVLQVGTLIMVGYALRELHLRSWSSFLLAYAAVVVHNEMTASYPFMTWHGIPIDYVMGFLWFLLISIIGTDFQQKMLTLALTFLLASKTRTSPRLAGWLSTWIHPVDPLLCNSFWIAFFFLYAFIYIQFAMHQKKYNVISRV